MSTSSCRTLACRWFEEVWNQRRADVVRELLHPEAVGHLPAGNAVGPDAFLNRVYRPFLAAFPDLKISVEDTLGDADTIAVRWRATGTHTGEGFGLSPTGRCIDIHGITWIQFRDGQMVEGWDCWDSAALMAQLQDPATAGA